MKYLKRTIGIFLIAFVCAFGVSGIFSVTVEATNRTQAEALQWVKSQVGKSIDYDRVYGAQCVDLIKAYYNYLGVSPVQGNGADYVSNSLPAGWQRIKGTTPQPGDILVYTGGYGHVAVFESVNSTYHQNFNYHSYVERVTIPYNRIDSPYWGVIRPNFSTATVPGTPVLYGQPLGYDIKLSWTAVSGATSYVVYHYSDAACTKLIDYKEFTGTSCTLNYESAMNYFRVRAKNRIGQSQFSNVKEIDLTVGTILGQRQDIGKQFRGRLNFGNLCLVNRNGQVVLGSPKDPAEHSGFQFIKSLDASGGIRYQIVDPYDHTVLTAANGGTANRTKAVFAKNIYADYQYFVIRKDGNKYVLQPTHSKYLTLRVHNGLEVNGREIWFYNANNINFGHHFTISAINSQQIFVPQTLYSKTYGNPSFSLNATAMTALTYYSNNTNVVNVDRNGVVTLTGPGKAVITIVADPENNYNGASAQVTITVKPSTVSMSSLKSGKKMMTVGWKKVYGATGYQIIYAQNSNFTKAKKSVTVNNANQISSTIKKLQSKKTYYVKICAFKMDKGEKIYGAYSATRKIKIK